jgi:hypothetical protein
LTVGALIDSHITRAGYNLPVTGQRSAEMKERIIFGIAVVFGIVGCSQDNKLHLENLAHEQVTLNFRGSSIRVPASMTGMTVTLPNSDAPDDIPNGDYEYSTTVTLPPAATKANLGEALAGVLNYSRSNTVYRIVFSSVLEAGEDGEVIYNVGATVSSSDKASESTPTQ